MRLGYLWWSEMKRFDYDALMEYVERIEALQGGDRDELASVAHELSGYLRNMLQDPEVPCDRRTV